jgi:hypothetical protein
MHSLVATEGVAMFRVLSCPVFMALVAVFSPQSYGAGACTHKIVPVEGAQSFTVSIPAHVDADGFARELERQISALAPSVALYKVSADRFLDFVFSGTAPKDNEKQILVYLVKKHFIGASGVTPEEQFHQSTAALLEAMRQSGLIISYEMNSQRDPSVSPVDRVTDICVPF